MMTHDLVAVIVNWKRGDLTERCIQSILAGSAVPAIVVVVENESPGPAVGWRAGVLDEGLAEGGARILRIHSMVNRGFAGGANLGIEIAIQLGGRAIALINNDVVVSRDCMGQMRDSMTRHNAAIVGGRCVSESDHGDVGYARRWPAALWGKGRVECGIEAGRELVEADMVDGALWMLSAECLQRSMERRGFFLDPLYFLYWEDADLCMFARRQGMKCVFDARATATHAVAASSGGSYNSRGLYYQSRNLIFFTCRWSSFSQLIIYVPVVLLNRLAAIAKHFVSGRWAQGRAVCAGLWEGLRGTRWKSKSR